MSYFDFEFALTELVPSKQQDGKEGKRIGEFLQVIQERIPTETLAAKGFPSDKEVFVATIQFFSSQKEYEMRDVDNISKTLMDCLKGRIYKDDKQVRSLLVTKKLHAKIRRDFVFVGIKVIKGETDTGPVQEYLLEQAVTFYNVHKFGA